MHSKILSVAKMAVVLWQRTWDNIHRTVTGLPTLKRSQITADLFLGSQYNLVGLKKLKAMGVTGIVNMRMNPIYKDDRYEGFHYLHLPTIDNTPPALDVLIRGANFIDSEIKAGGKVYVHCRQGLGRGPTMAIAYLISTGLTFEDAFALVKKVRSFIDPRATQIARLKELQAYYQRERSTTAK
jgi:hypothetical protein